VDSGLYERTFLTSLKQNPNDRFLSLLELHKTICADYCNAVERITTLNASRPSSDGRQVKLVVGHIMEWDRFSLICLTQMLSGVKSKKIFWKNGYVDFEGMPQNFESIEDFNQFQMKQQSEIPWEQIQVEAIRVSKTLLEWFKCSGLLNANLLENTEQVTTKWSDGTEIQVPAGWLIWQTILEHEGVEHSTDLNL
jgi:hypothetical protein